MSCRAPAGDEIRSGPSDPPTSTTSAEARTAEEQAEHQEIDERMPVAPAPSAAPDGPLSPADAAVGWVVSALSINARESYASVEARTATWAVETTLEPARGHADRSVTVTGARASVLARLADEATVSVTVEVDQAPQLRVYRIALVPVTDDRWVVASAETGP